MYGFKLIKKLNSYKLSSDLLTQAMACVSIHPNK